MGCCTTRSYVKGSFPWAILETLARDRYTSLKVAQITAAVYPSVPPTDDFLQPAQLEAIGSKLGVTLLPALFQETPDDPRIRRKKLFIALILFSADSESAKIDALLMVVGGDVREQVRFLEWREELTFSRLAKRVEQLNLLTPDQSPLPTVNSASAQVIAISQGLMKAKSLKAEMKVRQLHSIKP